MCVYTYEYRWLQRPEEGIEASGAEVTGGFSYQMQVLGMELGSHESSCMLQTAEPPLQASILEMRSQKVD